MKYHTHLLAVAALGTILFSSSLQAQQNAGKILVILPSASTLILKDGKTFQTGYYLNELVVPAERFTKAGYRLVFANPQGNLPPLDPNSVDATYFEGSQEKLADAQRFQLGLQGFSHPFTLKKVLEGDLSQYKAVFIPGGPAPMIDLMASRELGTILKYFHEHHSPTILLCHGPIALLSATDDPVAFRKALSQGDVNEARRLSADWTYKDYHITVFSNDEEAQAAKNVFHGEPQFSPQDALAIAGAKVSTVASWHPNVIQDRELITAENPFSDSAMMDLVLPALSNHK